MVRKVFAGFVWLCEIWFMVDDQVLRISSANQIKVFLNEKNTSAVTLTIIYLLFTIMFLNDHLYNYSNH